MQDIEQLSKIIAEINPLILLVGLVFLAVVWFRVAGFVSDLFNPVIALVFFISPIIFHFAYERFRSLSFSFLVVSVLLGTTIVFYRMLRPRSKAMQDRPALRTAMTTSELKDLDRAEEIDEAAMYLSDADDPEAAELYSDYEKYYIEDAFDEEMKKEFENVLLKKAQALEEAEELRLKEEANLEEAKRMRDHLAEVEEIEREQRRLVRRYGKKCAD